jgi:hypothetical protein
MAARLKIGSNRIYNVKNKSCVENTVNQYEYMSQEMKSMQLVIDILQEEINWLKKECKQDGLSGNLDPTNEHKHEGTLSSGYSKEWAKTNKNSHKILHIPKEPTPVITKTSNCFEVLHNFNEDGTQETPEGRSLIQFCTNNSNKKINCYP